MLAPPCIRDALLILEKKKKIRGNYQTPYLTPNAKPSARVAELTHRNLSHINALSDPKE